MRQAIIYGFAAAALAFANAASAQRLMRPRWNYQGSAVCPNGYDYVEPYCRPRGYGGEREYYGRRHRGGLPARWNRYGSAVCPSGYDYIVEYNGCYPQ